MPDLLVHGVLGYLIIVLKPTRYVIASIFLLGCIFPDLIRGPLLVLANLQHSMGVKIISPDLIISLQVLHSPVPLFFRHGLSASSVSVQCSTKNGRHHRRPRAQLPAAQRRRAQRMRVRVTARPMEQQPMRGPAMGLAMEQRQMRGPNVQHVPPATI